MGDAALPPAPLLPLLAAPASPFPPPLQPWGEAGLGRVGKGGFERSELVTLPGQDVGACALHIPSALVPGYKERVDAMGRGAVKSAGRKGGTPRQDPQTLPGLRCPTIALSCIQLVSPATLCMPPAPQRGGHLIPHPLELGGRGSQGTSSATQLISQEDI